MNKSLTYKWSIAKYHELIDKGILTDEPVQLLEGDIVTLSPEGVDHIYTTDNLADYLRGVLRERAKISEAHPITLDDSEPEPDIAILRLPKSIYKHRKPLASDVYWLIEIANTTLERDLGIKARIYARNNIPEYWVVDLKNKRLVVHTQPEDNKYKKISELRAGRISPQAFSNLEIPLSEIILY